MSGVRVQAGDLVGFAAVQDAESSGVQKVFLQVDLDQVGALLDVEDLDIGVPVAFDEEMVGVGGVCSGGEMHSADGVFFGAVGDVFSEGKVGVHKGTPFWKISRLCY